MAQRSTHQILLATQVVSIEGSLSPKVCTSAKVADESSGGCTHFNNSSSAGWHSNSKGTGGAYLDAGMLEGWK
jgi:hypothetical protein